MHHPRHRGSLLALALCCAAYALPVSAQNLPQIDTSGMPLLSPYYDGFTLAENILQSPLFGDAQNKSKLGVLFSPAKGLDLRADAWRVELNRPFNNPALAETSVAVAPAASALYIDDSALYAGLLEAPSVKNAITPGELAKGIDLSASYVWESPRFGQFIVSTKATYLYDTAKTANLLDSALPPVSDTNLLPKGSELQSSLMLTWQMGKHSASAVTHYFDSFEDLSKLNLEQLNELVGNMSTLDLQYGYNLKTGRQGQAVFSLGVRNLLDARLDQLPKAPGSVLEQPGRVAYGSIKYQF